MNTDLGNLLTNAVSRETAKETTRNWIDYATNNLKFSKQEVPKSILIPIIDIYNLIAAFKMHDEEKRELSGIRIYFTRKNSYEEKPEGVYLSCIAVPTVQGKSGEKHDHADAIIKIPSLRQRNAGAKETHARSAADGDSGETETIYNMTYPCPPYCNGADSFV